VSLSYYLDENVEDFIAVGLRKLGVDVITVQEDGYRQTPDQVVFD
jgi:hypothetical protein